MKWHSFEPLQTTNATDNLITQLSQLIGYNLQTIDRMGIISLMQCNRNKVLWPSLCVKRKSINYPLHRLSIMFCFFSIQVVVRQWTMIWMRALNYPGFMALFLILKIVGYMIVGKKKNIWNLQTFVVLWLGNNLHNDVIRSTRMWQTGTWHCHKQITIKKFWGCCVLVSFHKKLCLWEKLKQTEGKNVIWSTFVPTESWQSDYQLELP